MSGFQIDRDRTFIAGADLSSSQYRLVKLDSTQNQVVVATAGTDNIIGYLQNAPKSGYEARVTLLNAQGTTQVVASAAISKGAFITATTGGKAIATTTSGDTVSGVAIDAAAADGDLIEVIPMRFKY